jgi:hypothetical protein
MGNDKSNFFSSAKSVVKLPVKVLETEAKRKIVSGVIFFV